MRTLRDLGELNDKRVLVRVDFNVPIADGRVSRRHPDPGDAADAAGASPPRRQADPRLASGPAQGPRAGVLAGDRSSAALTELTGGVVRMAPAVVGDEVTEMADSLAAGEILLLENVRYEPGETKNDPQLAAALAALADVYVDDAFGAAHRAHASTVGVARAAPRARRRTAAREGGSGPARAAREPRPPARRGPRRRQGERQDQGDRALPRGRGHDPDRRRDGVPVPGGAGSRRRRLPL